MKLLQTDFQGSQKKTVRDFYTCKAILEISLRDVQRYPVDQYHKKKKIKYSMVVKGERLQK